MHASEYQQNDADLVANKFDRLSERAESSVGPESERHVADVN